MVKGLVLNDVHFGIQDSKRLYDELEQFKNAIIEKQPDFIVIAGDYFDRKLSLTDPAAFYAISFMSELVGLIKKHKIKLRIIKGTKEHDHNQLQMFTHYEGDEELDFRIIETVSTETIYGLDVLYIPEEYPENSEEYYKEFKEKKYNIIFGHGTWDFVAFDSQIEKGNKTDRNSAPIFMWKEWKDTIPNGFVSFGHIHGRNTYGKKIFYSGSFSRWGYGERSERGFTYFEYDLENLSYNVEFINNTLAPKYDVLNISDLGIDLDNTDVQAISVALQEQIDKTDNLRINLSGLSQEKISIFKKMFAGNPNIKVEVRESKKVSLKESKEQEDKFTKYHYITKRKMPLDQVIQRYCKEELNTEITLDKINSILKEG